MYKTLSYNVHPTFSSSQCVSGIPYEINSYTWTAPEQTTLCHPYLTALFKENSYFEIDCATD